jgi:hypothetical protein
MPDDIKAELAALALEIAAAEEMLRQDAAASDSSRPAEEGAGGFDSFDGTVMVLELMRAHQAMLEAELNEFPPLQREGRR